MQSKLSKIASMIRSSRHTVVFTGAGVSTESGVPDFRSPGGIWDRFDAGMFDYQRFLNDEMARQEHWKMLRSMGSGTKPNPAHHALARLCISGHVKAIITQNIDNLHQEAGAPPENVYELHGNMGHFHCMDCAFKLGLSEVESLMDKTEVPVCPECDGVIKPGVIFFGEPLPALTVKEAIFQSQTSDLFIVIGSTLTVYPAASMPEYALSSGSRLVIINLTPTPMDNLAEVVIHQKAGKVLPEIAGLVE